MYCFSFTFYKKTKMSEANRSWTCTEAQVDYSPNQEPWMAGRPTVVVVDVVVMVKVSSRSRMGTYSEVDSLSAFGDVNDSNER